MCVGPIFSETPTFLDWLQYYADLGVTGIHMYAAVAEFILHRDDYMHAPGSRRSVQFQSHRLITWRAFHPSRWSQHYYGQVCSCTFPRSLLEIGVMVAMSMLMWPCSAWT